MLHLIFFSISHYILKPYENHHNVKINYNAKRALFSHYVMMGINNDSGVIFFILVN